ncbi:MAG: hypothetical protein JNJ61_21420 [Anaerolineae bacterium]|nr:hypothetical protein [Anaerolineae bacterium]
MTRIVIAFSLVTIFLLGGANALARAIGTRQPANPALNGFDAGCTAELQPCWNGLVPGTTTYDEALVAMPLLGDVRSSYNSLNESYALYLQPRHDPAICSVIVELYREVISTVQLQSCPTADLQLGDLSAMLDLTGTVNSVATLDLVFDRVRIKTRWWQSVRARVAHLTLAARPQMDEKRFPWHGFVRLWRYCHLEPAFGLC